MDKKYLKKKAKCGVFKLYRGKLLCERNETRRDLMLQENNQHQGGDNISLRHLIVD